MNRKRVNERICLLSKDKESFKGYVDFYYSNEIFSGPSVYFHNKVINLMRNNDYRSLLENEHFIEYVYATLASWGMHRMGPTGSKMRDFKVFRQSILSNKNLFLELKKSRLEALTDENKEDVFPMLKTLFKNLVVMQSGSNLVGNSKVIHHLLPDLVPPIDRQYTIRFFYGDLTSKYAPLFHKEEETDLFLEIVDYFRIICKRLNLTENDYDKTKPFNTSIPKVIDNAMIGLIQEHQGLSNKEDT